ncbi:MAG: ABC transporter permease [Rhodothermales bacterium]
MIKNYLTIALRTVRRHKGYAAINIFGLAVGIACFLLMVLYIQHELSFDTYHEKGNLIYRIVSYSGFAEKQWGAYVSGDPVPEMRTAYTDVEDAVKTMRCGTDRIKMDQEVYRDIKMVCTESNLFNIFSFDLEKGDAASVLDRPNTAVITRSLAQQLFDDEDPVGKTLPIQFRSDDARLFEITGLMEDVPVNTHFTFDLLLSYESLRSTRLCLTCGQPMYALLAKGADPEEIAARALSYLRDVQGKELIEDLRLEPLADIHFSDILAERQGDVRYVYLLSAIALILLLIACANYMNLATARSARRTREVGVRKVLGAHRIQLIRQFLLETLLLTVLAAPLALVLLALALPFFNTLAETDVTTAWNTNGLMYLATAGIIAVVGLLAGCYPALFLSAFRPVAVLRGRLAGGFTGAWLRKGLVIFQFSASIILITVTFIILRQLDFMQTQKLGFNAEQVVIIKVMDPVLAQQSETLKQEFLRHARVTHATAGWGLPGQTAFHGIRFIHQPEGKDGPAITFHNPVIDADFLETMQVPLLAGRNVAEQLPEGGMEALISEAGLKAMGWVSMEEAMGQDIGGGRIVGVVKDFHFQSLHQQIEPLLMRQNQFGQASQVALRVEGENIKDTLADLEEIWTSLGTEMPFEFSFLTDELHQLYEREERAAQVFSLFAGLAILIACLGLFGLAAFAAEQRTKEIGIRKVLGATAHNIVVLLSLDFIRLVLVAFVVAVPAAYWAMLQWLEDFAYRIDPGPAVFILAGGVALLIALLTISFQAVRAALADPVDSLRYE